MSRLIRIRLVRSRARQQVVRLPCSDIIVLGVKPVYMRGILAALAPHLEPRHLVVSIAAGLKLDGLEAALPDGTRVVRVMPNTPCLIGAAASTYVMGSHANEEDKEKVDALMSSVGEFASRQLGAARLRCLGHGPESSSRAAVAHKPAATLCSTPCSHIACRHGGVHRGVADGQRYGARGLRASICVPGALFAALLLRAMHLHRCVSRVEQKPALLLLSSSALVCPQMLEAMADGAVNAGLPRDKAQALAAQTLIGAARMVSPLPLEVRSRSPLSYPVQRCDSAVLRHRDYFAITLTPTVPVGLRYSRPQATAKCRILES